MTHDDLCALAVRWLRRPARLGGHGCSVAVSECRSGYGGEIPDAIGFRANWNNGSVVVEAKVSRSDFLADRNKPHRRLGGMGTWRYFMAPAGVIRADELPERWGLLEVGARNRITAVVGPAAHGSAIERNLEPWRHDPDHDAERDLLTLLLARTGDPEKVNAAIKKANNAQSWMAREIASLRKENRSLRDRLFASDLAFAPAIPRISPTPPDPTPQEVPDGGR